MPFKTGHKKIGGRKAGVPNKDTVTFLQKLERSNFDTWEELMKVFPKLDPHVAAKVLLDLMQYQFPKRKAIELTSSSVFRRAVKYSDGTVEVYTNEPEGEET